jgi:hypothetical protein
LLSACAVSPTGKEPIMNRTIGKLGTLAALALAAGCSSGDNFSQTLSIQFNPMYSGFDGVHKYQIPATIVNASVNGTANVKWSSSDDSYVDLAADPNGIDVLITTKKAGKVTIIAKTADGIGKVQLTIASYTPDQWATGQTRYTSGSMAGIGKGGGVPKGGYVACTSCHGTSAGSLAIEHTPEQTGGFTDDQMKGIFLMGQLPASDANPLNIDPMQFASFHTWQVADDNEANGLIAYLRSLTPMSQGAIDFGGRGRPDGGVPRPDGGFGHGDGGTHGDGGHGGPPADM